MARLPYVTRAELPAEHRHVIESHRVHPNETTLVNRAIANNLPLAAARREFSRTTVRESLASDRERELVILTVAHRLGSRYEWHKHVNYARDEIVSTGEIDRIAAGDLEGFDDRERALIEYARRFADMDIDDATHEALAAHYDAEAIVGIGLLAMNYLGLAHVIDAFDVEVDDEFVGWQLDP